MTPQGKIVIARRRRGDLQLAIHWRQVVRLLTGGLEPFITVDDTGARHQRRDNVTTRIVGDRFTVFRTGRSKSRQNVLSLLRAGSQTHVVNGEALAIMRRAGPEAAICERLRRQPRRPSRRVATPPKPGATEFAPLTPEARRAGCSLSYCDILLFG